MKTCARICTRVVLAGFGIFLSSCQEQLDKMSNTTEGLKMPDWIEPGLWLGLLTSAICGLIFLFAWKKIWEQKSWFLDSLTSAALFLALTIPPCLAFGVTWNYFVMEFVWGPLESQGFFLDILSNAGYAAIPVTGYLMTRKDLFQNGTYSDTMGIVVISAILAAACYHHNPDQAWISVVFFGRTLGNHIIFASLGTYFLIGTMFDMAKARGTGGGKKRKSAPAAGKVGTAKK